MIATTKAGTCDICERSERGTKTLRFVTQEGDFHLNYCEECFQRDFPNLNWIEARDERKYLEGAKGELLNVLNALQK